MAIHKKSTKTPDETRSFDKGKVEIFNVGDDVVGLATFEPGWKWSEFVKPIAQTDSCQSNHFLYMLSGRMHVKMDDGTEADFGPGEVGLIDPGHDAWVVGNDTCKIIDFAVSPTYAKR